MNRTVTKIVGTTTGEIVFLGFPMNDDDRNRWCDWARQHGIDPHEAIGFFEIDREARKIRWLAYNLTDKGTRFLRPDGKWASASMREIHLDRPIADLPDACSDSTLDAEDFPMARPQHARHLTALLPRSDPYRRVTARSLKSSRSTQPLVGPDAKDKHQVLD